MNTHATRKAAHWGKVVLVLLAIYLLIAYIVMPQLDHRKSEKHPDLQPGEHLTRTGSGLPGDPIDIAMVGSEADLISALLAAGWKPADALSISSSVRIAVDTVFDKPDPNAPVSNLYLFGRKEDLAFEKPVGNSPKERHHVRFWKTTELKSGRPLWLGSATHDTGVELSRTTGQVTHHISPDIDSERDLLISDLTAGKHVVKTTWIDGYQTVLQGRNGGGDPWQMDSRLAVVTLTEVTSQ